MRTSLFSRLRRRQLALAACALSITVGAVSAPSSAARDDTPKRERGAPDPCARLLDVPGRADGLHKRCEPPGGGSGVARGDFNGDRIADLAIGVPDENVGGAADAGAVNIIYGSAAGLASTGNQFFTQNSPGVAGVPETGDRFGLTLAAGDFNGDGFSDLAVGTPFEDDVLQEEGFVQILEGSSSGLQPAEFWDAEELAGVKCGCRFGASLAWGDFDADGYGDLAIGMPFHDVRRGIGLTSVTIGGVVRILFGSANGLTANGSQSLHQDAPFSDGAIQVGDAAEDNDRFGSSLAAGDHDGDGFDDLAVGVPYEDTSLFAADAGIVHVVFGSPAGFFGSAIKYVQGEGDTPGASESGDRFGLRLAMGDLNGNGIDDLVVGVPYEDVGSDNDAGAVYVLERFGDRRGWDQDLIAGVDAEAGDLFGWALATADFNLDGYVDLAIGVPNEDFGSAAFPATFRSNVGLVHVLYGSFRGITTTDDDIWHQDVSGVAGSAEAGDQFGYSLSAWNFGKTGHRDLAVGIPGQNITTDTDKLDAGAVLVLYGSADGLAATDSQQWSQASAGILDAADTDDRFGASLY